MEESLRLYINKLNAIKAELVDCLARVPVVLTSDNHDKKISTVEAVKEPLGQLIGLFSESDLPIWVTELNKLTESALKDFATKQNYISLLHQTEQILQVVRAHSFDRDFRGAEGLDFDFLFETYRRENKLDELFKELLSLLSKISKSEDVDQEEILAELERAISTIEKNRRGSYFSLKFIWRFFAVFFKNTLAEYLAAIPAIGPLLKSLVDTIKQIDESFVEVDVKAHTEITKRYPQQGKHLSYNEDGLVISAIENKVDLKI